jgi:uncharacterized membrane protein YdbT with pleckstrin-like domain
MSTLFKMAIALAVVGAAAAATVLLWPDVTFWVEIGVAVIAPIVAEATRQYYEQRGVVREP